MLIRSLSSFAVLLLAALACSQTAPPTAATVGPGTKLGGGLELLIRDDVQVDIQLSGEQKGRLAEIRKASAEQVRKVHAKGGSSTELDVLKEEERKGIVAALKPEQVARLRQIEIQLQGNTAITYPDIADAIGLTEEQRTTVRSLVDQHLKNANAIVAKVRDRNLTASEARKQLEESFKGHDARLGAVLEKGQIEKLDALRGKPFVPAPPPPSRIGEH